jgi:hypothetical protein
MNYIFTSYNGGFKAAASLCEDETFRSKVLSASVLLSPLETKKHIAHAVTIENRPSIGFTFEFTTALALAAYLKSAYTYEPSEIISIGCSTRNHLRHKTKDEPYALISVLHLNKGKNLFYNFRMFANEKPEDTLAKLIVDLANMIQYGSYPKQLQEI